MSWLKWVTALCLVLALSDLVGGVCANDSCFPDRSKQQTTVQRPVPVPVKVRCDTPASKAERFDEARIVNEVRERQKLKRTDVAAARRSCPQASDKEDVATQQQPVCDAKPVKPAKPASGTTAECERCEIQIKASGDGLVLRCRRCHSAPEDGLRFPATSPARVANIP